MYYLLAGIAVLGIVLIFLKDAISRRVYQLRERLDSEDGNFALRALVTLVWMGWKIVSGLFYIFLFGFPLLGLFIYFVPAIIVAREHQLTLQYLLVYDQHDSAIELLKPTVDRKLLLTSPENIRADAAKLRSLFPTANEWNMVLGWAGGLARDPDHFDVPPGKVLTDDELAHLGWRALLGVPGATEADLLDLPAAIQKAIPNADHRTQLLAWGRARRDLYNKIQPKPYSSVRFPNLDWFAWWIVYKDYSPTDAVFPARKQHLLACLGESRFGRDIWSSLLGIGAERNNGSTGGQLPAGDRAHVVAALDY